MIPYADLLFAANDVINFDETERRDFFLLLSSPGLNFEDLKIHEFIYLYQSFKGGISEVTLNGVLFSVRPDIEDEENGHE